MKVGELLFNILRSKSFALLLITGGLGGFLLYYIIINNIAILTKQPEAVKSNKSTEDDKLIITLFANKIIVDDNFSIIEQNLSRFLNICSRTRLYLITQIPNEDGMKIVLNHLESRNIFKNGLLSHRAMFCSSPSGRISMIQQMQPHIHVEFNTEGVNFVFTRLPRMSVTTFDNIDDIINVTPSTS